MGPGSNQPAQLITERGKFHLELAFGGAGAGPEDLQDEAGAVDDLAAPLLLQITLLHWSKRMIDDGEADLLGFNQFRIALHRPLAEQRRWPKPLQRGDFRMRNIEVYGSGKADRLLQLLFSGASIQAAMLERRVKDQRGADPGHGAAISGGAGALHRTSSPRPPWRRRKVESGQPASRSRSHACRRVA